MLRAALAGALLAVSAAPARAVVNGSTTTTPGYMAMVLAGNGDGQYTVCGGTAVSRNVVLTAAHCAYDEPTRSTVAAGRMLTLFGEQDPIAAIRNRTAAFNPVAAVVLASQYGRLANGGAVNDVALLQLRDPVATTLPLVPTGRADLVGAGRPASFLGWGLTDGRNSQSMSSSLRSGTILLGLDSYCGRRIGGYDPLLMLCGTGTGPSSPCQGDSGGPLIVQDPATQARYAAGVVSFVEEYCPAVGGPPVFANVAGEGLGGFVAVQAARLQQAADVAAGRASSSAPVASAAAATARPRSVTARISRTDALARVRAQVRKATGRTPVFARYGCSRTGETGFRCQARWRDARYSYRGTLTVAERTAFRGKRAGRACNRERAFAGCARAYRFTR